MEDIETIRKQELDKLNQLLYLGIISSTAYEEIYNIVNESINKTVVALTATK